MTAALTSRFRSAAMQLCQATYQSEPDAEPADGAIQSLFALDEGIEHARKKVRADTGTGIFDLE